MSLVLKMLSLQLQLFLLIGVGVLASKINILTPAARKSLSSLLIYVILPCNIVNSFLGGLDVDASLLTNCAAAVALSLATLIISLLLNKLLFRRYPPEQKSVLSFGMLVSNSSFVGMPMAEALYGTLGVMYTSVYQIPMRFFMWTAGLSLFTKLDKKHAIIKTLTHPCVIAVFVGFVIMLLGVTLPEFLSSTVMSLSRCTLPVSMIFIGASLSDADIKSVFSRSTLYFTALRLVLYPLFIYVLLLPLPIDSLIKGLTVIMCGMPAAATTSIMAEQYDCDAAFASEVVFVSTLFSIVTMPMLSMLIQ
ncbi:MAG: AEC family transporter [Oscillospiraceae bacterium]|nr:AEC family transporter [Oscillospiraceae bacterium]